MLLAIGCSALLYSGLRQCVAYFYSELAKLDPSRLDSSDHMQGYYVSKEAGQRLQCLVNSGSINR